VSRGHPTPGAYQPFASARRPGGHPAAKPGYRVLVHRQFQREYEELGARCGVESAQQFWDHVAATPGSFPRVNQSSVLKGKAGEPDAVGFSRTIHYEISGAARINYQYSDTYQTTPHDKPHKVVRIKTISYSSH
jgi:hypothetical protein